MTRAVRLSLPITTTISSIRRFRQCKLGGLDPNRNYRIKDLTPWDEKRPCSLDGKVISGKTLMEVGLNLRSLINYNDASVALELREE